MSARQSRRVVEGLVVSAILLGMLLVTLGPYNPPPAGIQLWEWCYVCGAGWLADALRNTALFLPFGFALRWVRVRPFDAFLGIVATTFVIEVAQLFINGRITSVPDLVTNTLGGMLGYVIARGVQNAMFSRVARRPAPPRMPDVPGAD